MLCLIVSTTVFGLIWFIIFPSIIDKLSVTFSIVMFKSCTFSSSAFINVILYVSVAPFSAVTIILCSVLSPVKFMSPSHLTVLLASVLTTSIFAVYDEAGTYT